MITIVDDKFLIQNNIYNFIIVKHDYIDVTNRLNDESNPSSMHFHPFLKIDDIRKLFNRFLFLYIYVDKLSSNSLLNPSMNSYHLTYKAMYDDDDNFKFLWKNFMSE